MVAASAVAGPATLTPMANGADLGIRCPAKEAIARSMEGNQAEVAAGVAVLGSAVEMEFGVGEVEGHSAGMVEEAKRPSRQIYLLKRIAVGTRQCSQMAILPLMTRSIVALEVEEAITKHQLPHLHRGSLVEFPVVDLASKSRLHTAGQRTTDGLAIPAAPAAVQGVGRLRFVLRNVSSLQVA